ncbi:MAG: hypothetical protein OIF57_06135 [Marinobacterium sp.]|nr:hypothetical protein [Marinobacterium sp.]
MIYRWLMLAALATGPVQAVEGDLAGIIDVRYSTVDGIDSYVNGGAGKFRFDGGGQLALAQAGLVGTLEWDNGLSFHAVANGYADGVEDGLGISEAYLKYRTLPSESGLRHGVRLGIFYPAISLENNATAWSVPDTLTPSTMNSWVGEELRATGVEYTAELLGKFSGRSYDLKMQASLFTNNDPSGAMLSWHGWTLSSRQTLLHEKLPLPDMPARNDLLAAQAPASDPFHEEDDRWGVTLSTELKLPRKGLLHLGWYDNNATQWRRTKGQYGWRTRFVWAGFKWRLAKAWRLSGQIMQGDTLMQAPWRQDVVDNDYRSAYLKLSWSQRPHRISGRIEEFSVTDLDSTVGDNNDEYGKAFTLSYRYRVQKNWFLLTEFNWINSSRWARTYEGATPELIERQLQFASRYYF